MEYLDANQDGTISKDEFLTEVAENFAKEQREAVEAERAAAKAEEARLRAVAREEEMRAAAAAATAQALSAVRPPSGGSMRSITSDVVHRTIDNATHFVVEDDNSAVVADFVSQADSMPTPPKYALSGYDATSDSSGHLMSIAPSSKAYGDVARDAVSHLQAFDRFGSRSATLASSVAPDVAAEAARAMSVVCAERPHTAGSAGTSAMQSDGDLEYKAEVAYPASFVSGTSAMPTIISSYMQVAQGDIIGDPQVAAVAFDIAHHVVQDSKELVGEESTEVIAVERGSQSGSSSAGGEQTLLDVIPEMRQFVGSDLAASSATGEDIMPDVSGFPLDAGLRSEAGATSAMPSESPAFDVLPVDYGGKVAPTASIAGPNSSASDEATLQNIVASPLRNIMDVPEASIAEFTAISDPIPSKQALGTAVADAVSPEEAAKAAKLKEQQVVHDTARDDFLQAARTGKLAEALETVRPRPKLLLRQRPRQT
jgi:hypothetical protein